MKLLVVADEYPWPVDSGGKELIALDVEALMRQGVDLSLVAFTSERRYSEPPALRHGSRARDSVIPRRSLWKATSTDPLRPYHVASRVLPPDFAVPDASRPDVVIAHHEWTLPAARRLAERTGACLILRSHNDEVAFLRALAAALPLSARKAYLRAEIVRARRLFRPDFYRGVRQVWTVAPGDEAYYRRLGLDVTTVPPPIGHEEDLPGRRAPDTESRQVLFIGALDMPQATSGLAWFLDSVWPIVRATVPDATFMVAGRRGSCGLAADLAAREGVEYTPSPESADPLYDRAALFVNPVFAGSGINMKLARPALLGLPIVTTQTGVRGWESLASGIHVADQPRQFAAACVDLLTSSEVRQARSADLAASASMLRSDEIGSRMVALLSADSSERT